MGKDVVFWKNIVKNSKVCYTKKIIIIILVYRV